MWSKTTISTFGIKVKSVKYFKWLFYPLLKKWIIYIVSCLLEITVEEIDLRLVIM